MLAVGQFFQNREGIALLMQLLPTLQVKGGEKSGWIEFEVCLRMESLRENFIGFEDLGSSDIRQIFQGDE